MSEEVIKNLNTLNSAQKTCLFVYFFAFLFGISVAFTASMLFSMNKSYSDYELATWIASIVYLGGSLLCGCIDSYCYSQTKPNNPFRTLLAYMTISYLINSVYYLFNSITGSSDQPKFSVALQILGIVSIITVVILLCCFTYIIRASNQKTKDISVIIVVPEITEDEV
jgi:ribose/xylose/arabinose/galactoside ABC-type transport system permease subunit